ncbi:MAG: MFS transporter [Mucilaginibacter polytrichastri]|nr:MFS transporter [Mucilaginibacter polytrichastri]
MSSIPEIASESVHDRRSVSLFSVVVIVASLGYFVDIYDLLLFSIVRVPSLKALGFSGQAITDNGVFLLNVQMIGMLVGGIFWGVLGDKKGRLSVLFGSILLYSLANIANGFVHSLNAYALWRFIAGFGLAGELGAGITLVSEVMPKHKRGYATTMVASVGISGAVVAFFVLGLLQDSRQSQGSPRLGIRHDCRSFVRLLRPGTSFRLLFVIYLSGVMI